MFVKSLCIYYIIFIANIQDIVRKIRYYGRSGKIMQISKRLKEVRQALGHTQAKFAERIAVSTSYLAGMELGDKKVNNRTVKLVSLEFNVSEHWLRTGEGSMYSKNVDLGITKLTGIFRSLSAQYQECALNQISALADLHRADKE